MKQVSSFQKLGIGSFSIVFLKKQGKSIFVIKHPKYTSKVFSKKWFFHVCAENIFLKDYAPNRIGIKLPKFIEYTKSYCVQKYITGSPLTDTLYDKLPEKEQIKISETLATFFRKLHQKTKSTYTEVKKRARNASWLNFLDSDELKIYRQAQSFLKKNPQHFPFSCICITDLKAEHLLYDKKTKKIGIIDFGAICYGSPTKTFNLNFPIQSHLSLKMIKDIIQFYNKKSPVISLEFIKNNLIIASFKEVYENYINQKIPATEKKRLKKILLDFRKKLEVFSEV